MLLQKCHITWNDRRNVKKCMEFRIVYAPRLQVHTTPTIYLFILFFLYIQQNKTKHTQIKRKILRHGQKHKHAKDRTEQHISAQTSARHTMISPDV